MLELEKVKRQGIRSLMPLVWGPFELNGRNLFLEHLGVTSEVWFSDDALILRSEDKQNWGRRLLSREGYSFDLFDCCLHVETVESEQTFLRSWGEVTRLILPSGPVVWIEV